MTKGNVIQLGLLLLLLGVLVKAVFDFTGINEVNAGIASGALLAFMVFTWVISYFFRVFTGRMTFMEQRKRYREEYEEITNNELQKKFKAMPDDEKNNLINELGAQNNENK